MHANVTAAKKRSKHLSCLSRIYKDQCGLMPVDYVAHDASVTREFWRNHSYFRGGVILTGYLRLCDCKIQHFCPRDLEDRELSSGPGEEVADLLRPADGRGQADPLELAH